MELLEGGWVLLMVERRKKRIEKNMNLLLWVFTENRGREAEGLLGC